MKILNNTIIDCDSCGNIIDYSDEDIQYTHELHNETSKMYSYKIKYIECKECRSRIILEKLRLSPGT